MPKNKKNNSTTFVCEAGLDAKQVFLAGDFNGWDESSLKMNKRGGSFSKKVELAPGEYQYKFIVDGEWRADPSASMQVEDDHGGLNSVIKI